MGCSGLILDGNISGENTSFLYSFRISIIAGGRIMVRKAAFVLGSQMMFFPPTGVTCLLINSTAIIRVQGALGEKVLPLAMPCSAAHWAAFA